MKTYTVMICLSCAASAFEVPRTGVVPRNSHSHSQLFASAANGRGPGRPRKTESLDYDPYGGFLDVDTVMPTTGSVADALLKEWSLEEETADDGSALVVKTSELEKKPLQWENWDPFMEEQFGDMDRVLEGDEEWMYEVRDAVELKRGVAIWSARSDKEISSEKAKAAKENMVHVPPNFEHIITCVFLDKTHSMKDMRAENELACIEFRKWMVENRKHFKKDPVPVVKCEVARKWLLKHPAAALQARGLHNKPPQVVMDELRSPLADVHFELKKTGAAGDDANVRPMSTLTGASPSMPSSGAAGGAGGKKSAPAKITTSSMLYWDFPEVELPMSMTVATARPGAAHSGRVFKIDDVDILVATEGDYYVVC